MNVVNVSSGRFVENGQNERFETANQSTRSTNRGIGQKLISSQIYLK